MSETITATLLALLGLTAVVSAIRVFLCDSMVRAAYWLLVSFVAVGFALIVLGAQFLGLSVILMMAGEMTIMAVMMVMFMMNPAGLNPMTMVHQNRTAVVSGVVSFLALGAVAFADFPDRQPVDRRPPTVAVGDELLEDSMLVFQMAGFTLLATMIGSVAIASRKGRYGEAYDPSLPPPLDPEPLAPEASAPEAPVSDAPAPEAPAAEAPASEPPGAAMEGMEGMEGAKQTSSTEPTSSPGGRS